jgi:hypothetical protein
MMKVSSEERWGNKKNDEGIKRGGIGTQEE